MAAGDLNDLRDTWDNVGTAFRGIKLNATDTASAAGSLLMELLKDNVRKFEVGKDSSIRYGPDASNYWQHLVSATGDLALTGVGSTGGALTVTPAAGKNFNVVLSGASIVGVLNGAFVSPPLSVGTFFSVASNGGTRISILGNASALQSLAFGDDSDEDDGLIEYANSGQRMSFYTAATERVRITSTGNVGVGTGATASARLHASQPSTTAAIPVLRLNQADLSEELIRFESTVGVGNPIEAVGAKSLTTTHFIRVHIQGVGNVYLPVGTIA